MTQTPPSKPATRAGSPSPNQKWKTLVIWAVLTALFMATYQVAGGNAGHGFWVIAGSVFAILFVLFLIIVAKNTREFRRFHVENAAAVAALHRGELESGRATFWRWAEEASVPRITAIALHNLAWTLLRQGQLAQAIEVGVDNNERYIEALKAVGLAPTSAVDVALCHALANNVDEARRWLAITDQRNAMLSMPSVPAMRAYAQAVIDCRSGNPAGAARALDERWNEYEALLTGDIVRPLRVVRAFAHAAEGPRHAGVAEMDLVSLRPAFPNEYAQLSAGWPEMGAFLAAHDLAR